METFKKIHYEIATDWLRVYDFRELAERCGFMKMLDKECPVLDCGAVSRMWKIVLFKLPVVAVCVGTKTDKDFRIIDNYRQLDALMRLYGYKGDTRFWMNPKTCELALEKSDDFCVELSEVFDTFRMIELRERLRTSGCYTDSEWLRIEDNLKTANARMQTFDVQLHCVQVKNSDRMSVLAELDSFYNPTMF